MSSDQTANIYSFIVESKQSSKDGFKILDQVESVSGFDILFILQFILESKVSGYLNIIDNDNNITGVSFSEGSIVKVDFPDQENLLGNLLVQFGYLTAQELQDMEPDQLKKIGEKLIKDGKITEEKLIIVLRTQMVRRLENYLHLDSYQINFVRYDQVINVHTRAQISYLDFLQIAWVWISKLLDYQSIQKFYLEWMHKDILGQSFDVEKIHLNTFDKAYFKEVVFSTIKFKNLFDLIRNYSENIPKFFMYFHFAILSRALVFGQNQTQPEDVRSAQELESLRFIYSDLQNKEKVQLLKSMAQIVKVPFDSPNLVYKKFVNLIFGLAKDTKSPYRDDLFKMAQQVLENADIWLEDSQGNTTTPEQTQVTLENFLKQARALIMSQNYYELTKKIQTLKKTGFDDPLFFDFLSMWQYLMQAVSQNHQVDLRGYDVRLKASRSSVWVRQDYDYVLSLYYLLSGSKELARKSYLKAASLNPFYVTHPISEYKISSGIVNYLKKIFNI